MSTISNTSTILTVKGYSIHKSKLSDDQVKQLEKDLMVTPAMPQQYAKTLTPFPLYLLSPTRYYVPQYYGLKKFGKPDKDNRPEGDLLRKELEFNIKLRDYQEEIEKVVAENNYNGILSIPCGYGKTFMGIKFARNVGKKFLVVVHKEFLMAQWNEELSKSLPGIKIGKIQGEKLEIGEEYDCAIAMIQTLCSRTYIPATFSSFGMAIFDECHHLGAEVFSRALQQIHTKHMIGLSATPDRADGLRRVFEYYLGPIIYQIKTRDADKTVEAHILNYTTGTEPYCDTPTNWKGDTNMPKLVNLICEDDERNNEIVEWILPIVKEEHRQTLILSDRREHLTAFFNKLTKHKTKPVPESQIGFYVGQMKQTDLDITATKQIILGTFPMAAEGMNIPTLNTLLLATPKANVTQSVGRILRQKPEDRKVAPLILDVCDRIHDPCIKKFYGRRRFYKSCGYKIVNKGFEKEEKDHIDKDDVFEHVAADDHKNPFLDE
jgi:superfamily II DNA or RNA helicase